MNWGPDRWRLYGLALGVVGRAVRGAVSPGRARAGTPVPERLILAPQDLRTADPTVADDIYAGHFVFAGRVLEAGGRSPFDLTPPSQAWAEAFYGFGWLRHLRAAETSLARANARSLADDFIGRRRGDKRLSRRTAITARRVISFLSQSPLLLNGADHGFYRRFLRAIGAAVRDLERDVAGPLPPLDRLAAVTALCYAGLCCAGFEALLRRASRLLARELDRQIQADGGHLSRNPQVLIDLLLDLLPLRQIYAARGIEVPDALMRAIDRMLPMLRLFRHADGTLSHFNGMGATAADHIATLLVYGDARAKPISHAPLSGYERLEAGDMLLVADVGPAPPLPYSRDAHAGCLSFELSSGMQRIVINCGAPRWSSDTMRLAARATDAHSTACIPEVSSCRFLVPRGWWGERRLGAWLERRLGPVVVAGPRQVPSERRTTGGLQTLVASHDGYLARYGLTHERRWRLSANGDWLEGDDLLTRASEVGERPPVLIRFHIAPGIRASRVQGGRAVLLMLPNRESWQITTSARDIRLEESIYFGAPEGPRRTEQVVLVVQPDDDPAVTWRFERLTRPPTREG